MIDQRLGQAEQREHLDSLRRPWRRGPILRFHLGSPISGLRFPPRDRQTPEALGAFHKAEIEKWWPIIKAAGIRAE
jgi:hypothetical protein